MNVKEKLSEVLRQSVFLTRAAVGSVVSRLRWFIFTQRGRRIAAGLALTGAVAMAATTRPVAMIEPGQLGIRINLLTGRASELREGWALIVPQVHRLHLLVSRTRSSGPTAAPAPPAPRPSSPSRACPSASRSPSATRSIRRASPRWPPPAGRRGPGDRSSRSSTACCAGTSPSTPCGRSSPPSGWKFRRTSSRSCPAAGEGRRHRCARCILGNVDLPAQYRTGLEAMLAEELATEKMRYTLELKEKQVKESELEAEAAKVQREKAAEAAATRRSSPPRRGRRR